MLMLDLVVPLMIGPTATITTAAVLALVGMMAVAVVHDIAGGLMLIGWAGVALLVMSVCGFLACAFVVGKGAARQPAAWLSIVISGYPYTLGRLGYTPKPVNACRRSSLQCGRLRGYRSFTAARTAFEHNRFALAAMSDDDENR
jgi:hypothetical protein